MPVVRPAALCAAVITLAACGAEPPVRAATAETPTATPVPSGLQLVAPPSVTFDGDQRTLDIWVRLNRPLRHTIGHAAEYGSYDAVLDVPGAQHDGVVGLESYSLFPTCYAENVGLAEDRGPELVDGTPIEVSLILSDSERLTAAATLRERPDGDYTPPAKALGCPNRAPGLPPVRACRGEALGIYEISVVSVRGTTCGRGLEVMRGVARDATSKCYRDLCIRGAVYRHYRCKAALNGEAAWDIACRRGKAEIRGFTAD